MSSSLRAFPLHILSLCAMMVAASGCMTTGDGDKLRKDIDELKAKLATAQVQSEKERKQLQKVMEQATGLLTRNNADVGAQVDRLQNKLTKLSGTSEENTKILAELAKKYQELVAKVDVRLEKLASGAGQKKQDPVPEDKNTLFAQGKTLIEKGKHQDGRRLLQHFIARFGSDARVAEVYLLLGNSYYSQGKFANAIQEYRKIFEQHRRSKVYPDALYKIGMSFYQLKYCGDARTFFSELVRKHRRHPRAKGARKVLKLIRRFRKNRRFCTN
jgi:TolA-binding protein